MPPTPVRKVDGDAPAPAVVAEAARVLAAGGILVYPTDTLYAIGGRALDAAASARVRRVKGRDADKPLPVVAADTEQARSLVSAWPPAAAALAARFWPGPLTLVLTAGPAVPGEVTAGTGTVGVRVPGRGLTRRLCAAAGPLISTSANPAGGPPPLTCGEALAGLGETIDLALDAGPGRAVASTVVDLTGAPPRLLRAGAVEWAAVLDALKDPSR